MASSLNEEMVASYSVGITGVDRTQREMAALDAKIAELRSTSYSSGVSLTVAANLESQAVGLKASERDIFQTKFRDFAGRVQTGAGKAMASGMALGKRVQQATLEAATTTTGLNRGRGNGPGRNDTGTMIKRVATNVETYKGVGDTQITGWHGWQRDARGYFEFQENGTRGRGVASLTVASGGNVIHRNPNKPRAYAPGERRKKAASGVPAANSLGAAIPVVREHLKRELAGLKR